MFNWLFNSNATDSVDTAKLSCIGNIGRTTATAGKLSLCLLGGALESGITFAAGASVAAGSILSLIFGTATALIGAGYTGIGLTFNMDSKMGVDHPQFQRNNRT